MVRRIDVVSFVSEVSGRCGTEHKGTNLRVEFVASGLLTQVLMARRVVDDEGADGYVNEW